MKTTVTRHVDEEPGEYRYSYDVHRFTEGSVTVVAWSYTHQAEEAFLHHLEFDGVECPVCAAYLTLPLVRESLKSLQGVGKKVVTWRGPTGFEIVPPNA